MHNARLKYLWFIVQLLLLWSQPITFEGALVEEESAQESGQQVSTSPHQPLPAIQEEDEHT